jgi:hypothetical protein
MKLPVLCAPAVLYLILSIIGILFGGSKFITVFHIVWIVLWTFLLSYLCSIGMSTVSWILVLLPIIILAILIFTTVGVVVASTVN